MFRFMALLWNADCLNLSAAATALQRQLEVDSPWQSAFEGSGIRVLVAGCSAGFKTHAFVDGAGVVVGEVFARPRDNECAAPANDAQFNRFETREALRTRGRSLVSAFWGNYVAFVVDEGQLANPHSPRGVTSAERARHVFSDPCGTLPCYFTEHRGVRIVFSSLEDCRRAGLRFTVNWQFVRNRTVHSFLDTELEALMGVSAVHRGECVTFNERGKCVSRSLYWHPSTFANAEDLITDPAAAVRALHASVRSCVLSLARHHERVLAQVSGGLDSSIVLGCLSEGALDLDVTCYTVYTRDSVSDERRWADHAIQKSGYRQIEIELDARKILYGEFEPLAPTVEPGCYYAQWQRGPLDRRLADAHGASAIFTGEGGDSTLCATTYSYAADHCMRRHGLGLRTLLTAMQVAARRDRTVWKVLAKAVARNYLGAGNAEERSRRDSFNRLVSVAVKREVLLEATNRRGSGTSVRGGDDNIWSRLQKVSEETRQRLGTLAFPPEFYDLTTSVRSAAPHAVAPLCAQPVMEICMRIPVDVHFDLGRSRGLARRAFADVVPAPILRRQWKDHPVRFFDEVLQNNLPFFREHLLSGALVREGILDRKAVEQALRSGPTRGEAVSAEIFSHLDLELWIRDSARR
jgi:asparagine synthase (glutamine-hydrolysing)